jgi:hypothetical protein
LNYVSGGRQGQALGSAISKNRAILAKSIVHTQKARFLFFFLASWRSSHETKDTIIDYQPFMQLRPMGCEQFQNETGSLG